MDQFFTARFNRLLKVARQTREEKAKTDPEAINEPLTIAFDGTSISTYSSSIEDAEYGKAKDNPELKQVNQTLACDQKTGEVPSLSKYFLIVNQEGTETDKWVAPILSKRKIKSSEESFQKKSQSHRRTASMGLQKAVCTTG